MNTRLFKTKLTSIAATLLLLSGTSSFTLLSHAQTAPPPSIGEDTKGQPAITDEAVSPEKAEAPTSNQTATPQAITESTTTTSPFGSATIKETRRENGQRYRVEMQHSAGAKQVIEETDSDGSLENVDKGIDDTPNLPKWTLGSW
jgi:hypothetical protein